MVRGLFFSAVTLSVLSLSGCRCCSWTDCYADKIDNFNDCQVLWDSWYCPRLDISRAGKPDWCSRCKQKICPCRCQQGCWYRYDDVWLYPPSHPTYYPSQALVPGVVGEPPVPSQAPAQTPSGVPPSPVMPQTPLPAVEPVPIEPPPAVPERVESTKATEPFALPDKLLPLLSDEY